MKKKVILVLVDSLLPGPLEQAMDEGKVPIMNLIKEAGVFYKDGVTVLPTMSCSIDTSLTTGVFPHKHKIPGLVWYHSDENRIVNYGSSFGTVWRLGFKQVLEDILYKLNKEHISKDVETIYEVLERRGFTVGNINLAVYRGKQQHDVKLPFLVNLATSFSLKEQLKGPNNLSIGKLTDWPLPAPYKLAASTSVFKRYGLNDDYTVELFQEVVRQGQLPDFLMTYLPDLDQAVHKNGTNYVIKQVEKVDNKLAKMMEAFGGPEKALEEAVWIIISDHGQTDIDPDKARGQIPLHTILKDFSIHNLRNKINSATTDLIICNNERLAYIYPFRKKQDPIIEALKQDDRIDWIAYPDGKRIIVEKREQKEGYIDDLKLIFSKDGEYIDKYDQSWEISGDKKVLDLHIVGNHVEYKEYPDALMRLYGAVFAQRTKDVLIVTARPGHEFQSQGSAKHNGGGSHGSLHRQDSEIPIIIGGTDKRPKYPRIVDLKQFILALLQK